MTGSESLFPAPETQHVWKPLGVRRTLYFFWPWHRHRGRFASWRHFGWELSIEIGPGVTAWIERMDEP